MNRLSAKVALDTYDLGLLEVAEFYRMSGDIDYMLKMQVSDIAAYDAVYQKLIRSVRLSDVSYAFAMEEIKHTTCVPLPT